MKTIRLLALATTASLCSCGSLDRMLNPGPASARSASSQRMMMGSGPMGASYDEFDVMRYGIMKRQMESMTGGAR
jgi:hypothetical protein